MIRRCSLQYWDRAETLKGGWGYWSQLQWLDLPLLLVPSTSQHVTSFIRHVIIVLQLQYNRSNIYQKLLQLELTVRMFWSILLVSFLFFHTYNIKLQIATLCNSKENHTLLEASSVSSSVMYKGPLERIREQQAGKVFMSLKMVFITYRILKRVS